MLTVLVCIDACSDTGGTQWVVHLLRLQHGNSDVNIQQTRYLSPQVSEGKIQWEEGLGAEGNGFAECLHSDDCDDRHRVHHRPAGNGQSLQEDHGYRVAKRFRCITAVGGKNKINLEVEVRKVFFRFAF